MPRLSAIDRAIAVHKAKWGEPDLVVRAPGRVNLIGDHTDYNEGFTLPMALPFDTAIALTTDGDSSIGTVTVESAGFGEIELDPAGDPTTVAGWARHLAGVVSLLPSYGVPSAGWRATIESDIPIGASLSSSAALEVAAIKALLVRAGIEWEPIDIARLGQRVENEVVGLPSGIMDQFISAGAVRGHVSLMDCLEHSLTPVPLPDGVVVAIMDTGTRRVLAEVAYGDRRAACQRAVAELGVRSLRDANSAQVARIVDPVDRRRAQHVVTENQRTIGAVRAMRSGDIISLGRLMSESHASLRDDYEVSGDGLDAIVDAANNSPGCLGARMTGGGFAGCAVALVRTEDSESFRNSVLDHYRFEGHQASVWICAPAQGASIVSNNLS